MIDKKFNKILNNCRSKLSKNTVVNWGNNPDKKFVYYNNNFYTGSELLKKIKNKLKNIDNYKKEKLLLFLVNENSLDWLIIYISFKLLNSYIFILPVHTENKQKKDLMQMFLPNYIYQKNKLKLLSKSKNKFKKIAKHKKIKIYEKKIYDVIFTTGSSNAPKGVCIEEKSYTFTARNLIKILKQNKNDCELLSMSFAHSFGLTRLRCCLLTGQSIYITEGLKDFPKIYSNKEIVKYNSFSMVPSALFLIKSLLKTNAKKFSSNIKYIEIGSSFINKELRKWLKQYFKNTIIMHHYGSTEASRSFFSKRGANDNFKIDGTWIGYAAKTLKYKLETKKEIKNKNIKELLISGSNIAEGYIYGEENVSNNSFKPWYRTKDLVIEKNKKIHLIGKLTSLINVGGEKVLPEEIESKLEEIKEIDSSICGAINDDMFGERIASIISLRKNSVINYNNLEKKINEKFKKLPFFKKIKKFKIIKEIPKTINGKKNRNSDIFNEKIK